MALKLSRVVEVVVHQTATAIERVRVRLHGRIDTLERRLAALERQRGGEATADAVDAKAGDIVEMGNGRWLCRGAGRWRRLEDA